MTPEQLNDALRDVAIYDGAIWHVPANKNCDPYWKFFDSEGLIRAEMKTERLKYHTSYDWLMPVAKKVVAEIIKIKIPEQDNNKYITLLNLERSIYKELEGFDIDRIFAAVHSAIQLLNKYKATT